MLSPGDAIVRLLSGSGLRANATSGGGFIIETAPSPTQRISARSEAPPRPKLIQSEDNEPVGALDTESGGLSEIVVTAQRREENLQDVPVAVSAISTEALQQNQIADINSLQRLAPSLTAAPFGDATSPLLAIRGLVAQDILASVDPAVGVYVDGIYLGRATGANLAFIDVERVEVLRG
ncbi:MAG: TonB-dependent receptor plug domain-containing protein, partial [Novosphingobium sp.]|nr:TonB-dependent receptor plug domain-containing protein [Novosphingobium sp.]